MFRERPGGPAGDGDEVLVHTRGHPPPNRDRNRLTQIEP
jgi:hypothetical protein